jgi:hypothetical protein
MSKKVERVVMKVDLTDAQKYALYRAVENSMRLVGQRSAKVEDAIRLPGIISGSTAMALDRKGLVTRGRDHYYKSYYDLTIEGRRLGEEEFERVRGKTPLAWAEELQAAADKKTRDRKEHIDSIANLFTGMTVVVNKSRRSLPKVIAERLDREGPNVKLHESELKSLGQQIQNLVP